jgi:hypothetical protein
MDLQYKIICHPNELLFRNNKNITEWLDEIVSNKNITIELPITNDIYYPISLYVTTSNGISRFQILKAAFYFYMENEIDNDFLINLGIKVDSSKKCVYEYISENIKEIKSIEKIDDDEFILLPKSEIQIQKMNFIQNNNRGLAVLCKKCSLVQLVYEKDLQCYINEKYNCKGCYNILVSGCSKETSNYYLNRILEPNNT